MKPSLQRLLQAVPPSRIIRLQLEQQSSEKLQRDGSLVTALWSIQKRKDRYLLAYWSLETAVFVYEGNLIRHPEERDLMVTIENGWFITYRITKAEKEG